MEGEQAMVSIVVHFLVRLTVLATIYVSPTYSR
jgi:hypothetical protein